MLSGLSRCGGAGTLGTWAGLYIDTSITPTVMTHFTFPDFQVNPFNNLTADCLFRTNDATFWSLSVPPPGRADVALVAHKGTTAYAFYAEAGCRVVPSGGGGFAGVDVAVWSLSIEVFMDYEGPDVSVNPAGSTVRDTAPQHYRGVWDTAGDKLDFVWLTRSSMWIDETSAAGDDWPLTLNLVQDSSTAADVDIYEAYLHVFAVPVTDGIITTTLPHS